MMKQPQKIYVGLSGGVDSSVGARRLLAEGHDVVGVFIKVWHPDKFPCNWEAERLDAMRVAAHLGIPFTTFDAETVYKKDVADYMIEAYKSGYTPNPDVMCNKAVKFDAFLNFAREQGADAIATGHYAQVRAGKDGKRELLRGTDNGKDQSYFLWTLTNEQLPYVHFPVGDTPKEHIRDEAKRHSLITAEKRDSQGICFLGQIDMKEFLQEYVETKPGAVLDTSGSEIGTHDGALFYTIGQRHGFKTTTSSTNQQPFYVTSKDIERNTIIVAKTQPTLSGGTLNLSNCNWIGVPPEKGEKLEVQIRYRQTPIQATLEDLHADTATVTLQDDTDLPARGQSCVCYQDERCLGGGIIESVT